MEISVVLGIIWMVLPIASNAQSFGDETEPQKVYIESSQLAVVGHEIFVYTSYLKNREYAKEAP